MSLSCEGVTVLDTPTEQAPSSVLPTPDANLDSQVVVLAAQFHEAQEQEDDASVCTHHNSSWENFYETMHASLKDSQACANWSTNLHNLADVLKSIGAQIQK